MAKKSNAHETWSLLFAQEGVPSTLVMDGAREQVLGEFVVRLGKQNAMCNRLTHTPHGKMQLKAQ